MRLASSFAFFVASALALGCGSHGSGGCPTGARASARSGFVPVLTPATNQVVVLDGWAAPMRPFADLWRYSFGSCPGWQTIAPATASPGARGDYAADLDTMRNRIVYTGGSDGTNALGDVWALDADTLKLTQLMSVGDAPPLRAGRFAAYDATNDRLLLLGDVAWELDFGTLDQGHWLPLFAGGTAPTPRIDMAAAVDPGRSLAVLFGGDRDLTGVTNELWGYDFLVDKWQSIATSGDVPGPRSGARMAYDAQDKLLLVFGGSDGTHALDDLYTLQLDGNGVNATFTRLSRGNAPPARSDFGMVVSGNLLWVFGGTGACGQLDDVWTLPLDGGGWTKVIPQSHC